MMLKLEHITFSLHGYRDQKNLQQRYYRDNIFYI